jgi:hypothetical protein
MGIGSGYGGMGKGYKLLYYTSNGTTWAPVPNSPLSAAATIGVFSMDTYNKRFYFGTANYNTGGKVFEMGVPQPLTTCSPNCAGNILEKVYKDWLDDRVAYLWHFKHENLPPNPKSMDSGIGDRFIEALEDIEIPSEAEGLRSEALEDLRIMASDIEAASEYHDEALVESDPAARLELVNAALESIENARSRARHVTELLSAIAGHPNAELFHDAFDLGISQWDVDGGIYADEFLGDPVLLGEQNGTARARDVASSEASLLRFRILPMSGSVHASAGSDADGKYVLTIETGRLSLWRTTSEDPELLGSAEIEMLPFEWQVVQIEKRATELGIWLNGSEQIHHELGDREIEIRPEFVLAPGAVAFIDDVGLSRLF